MPHRGATLCEHAQLPDNGHRAALIDKELAAKLCIGNHFSVSTLKLLYPQLDAASARKLVIQGSRWMTPSHRQVILRHERRSTVIHAMLDTHDLTPDNWEALAASERIAAEIAQRVLHASSSTAAQARVLRVAGRADAISWFALHAADMSLPDADLEPALDRHVEGAFERNETHWLAVIAQHRPALVDAMLARGDAYHRVLSQLPWDDRSGPLIAAGDDFVALCAIIGDPSAPDVCRAQAWERAYMPDDGAQLRRIGMTPLALQPRSDGVPLDRIGADLIDSVLYQGISYNAIAALDLLAGNANITVEQADRLLHMLGSAPTAYSWPSWQRSVARLLERFPDLSADHGATRRSLDAGQPRRSAPHRESTARVRTRQLLATVAGCEAVSGLDGRAYVQCDAARVLAHAAADLTEAQWKVLFGLIDEVEGSTSDLVAAATMLA